MSRTPLQSNQERLEEIRRKRTERMNQLNQGAQGANRTQAQIIKRQFASQRSESVHVPPTIIETYQKQTQCALQTRSLDSKPAIQNDQQQQIHEVDLLQPKQHKRKREQNRKDQQLNTLKAKQLTEEQLDTLVKSKHFNDFFNKSSKFLEKVLDHGDGDMIQLLLRDGIKSKQADKHIPLTQVGCFADPNFTTNRVVTDIDWSAQISDLFLASYSKNEQGNIKKDHVGVVLVWNPSLRSRPQFYCFCQSAVTSAKFFPYSNSTIIGGCYNGQLLLWDVRTKAMPVQRTGVSDQNHKYPINSLNVVGTQIANNIVSFSNDGKMGVWDIKQFSKPVRMSEIKAHRPVKTTKSILSTKAYTSKAPSKQVKQVHEVNVTCAEFPGGDANKYYIGSLNGAMYRDAMHNTQPEQVTMYNEHQGPVSSLSVNNSQHQALSGLVLTSSFDWTVKLWSPNNNKESKRTFQHSDDYVYDVCWNPGNSAIFASVNNEGMMHLFDLMRDVQQPIGQTKINNQAQNKCKWNNDGSIIISGDTAGNINMMVLNERLRKLDTSKLQEFENMMTEIKDDN